MGVFFHILSTGSAGSGASRTTRYIAERDRDPTREGPGSRPLFSDDREDLSYHKADRILDPYDGRPDKDDLIHFSVMITEEDFDKLGKDEKEKQERFREMIREGMKGMAAELNVEELTWVAGIHRNSQNPHAHIVMKKDVIERGTDRPYRLGRIPRSLLPHRDTQDGKEVIVNGPIGDRFVAALEHQQQMLHVKSQERAPELSPAEKWEQLASKYQKSQEGRERGEYRGESLERAGQRNSRATSTSLDRGQIAASWGKSEYISDEHSSDFRIALGNRLELEMRLAFAEVWQDRALRHGDTYRFEVVDQSTGEERKISDLDVRRRATARATRLNSRNHDSRNQAIDADLSQHSETLHQLAEARETKIAALGKDIGSLRSVLSKVEQRIVRAHEMPAERELTPLISRDTLSELQQQAIKLSLPEQASELERLRLALAREHSASTRTDCEAATLAAELNVSRADVMAKDVRLERFEASVHLARYEVAGDRWSLAELDKQIARRTEDTKIIPERAARLDLRSLARINYSPAGREAAVSDVEHLTYVRSEIVRQIEERRSPLRADRDVAREMLDLLENSYGSEQRSREHEGRAMPDPRYERVQVNSLESSAETLRDQTLLREVHEWEKVASKTDSAINWEGRTVAREITSTLAVNETKERLQHFLESQRVASLHLGNHRTGTLREVEARTLTDYLVRAMETRDQRDHRQAVKLAAREHHGRLVSDFEKAQDYHEAARELAAESTGRVPLFTDKEKINLEIYAERQNDPAERDRFLQLALSESHSQEQDVAASRSR
ncbi:MAG TPA: hypothetical protein VN956_19205 [Pyrinomonadaceae bacterium]|nr:hypothetical protein [Pyrinomonadaceae bacterium]